MPNPTVPDFTELGARKLAELQPNGYEITGKEPTISSPVVPDFTGVAARKLADLLEKGFVITGVCFERQVEGTQPQRGFVDFAGFVGWWRAEMQPRSPIAPAQIEAAGELEDNDSAFLAGFYTGARWAEEQHGITAHGVADMKGGQDVDR